MSDLKRNKSSADSPVLGLRNASSKFDRILFRNCVSPPTIVWGRNDVFIREGVQTLQVIVRDNNVEQALRVLKKKLQREGVFREMKRRRSYEKPSERKAREKSEAVRRARKLARKQAIREGLIAAPPQKKERQVRKPALPLISGNSQLRAE